MYRSYRMWQGVDDSASEQAGAGGMWSLYTSGAERKHGSLFNSVNSSY